MTQSTMLELGERPAGRGLGGRAAIVLGLALYVVLLGAASWWALQWLPDSLTLHALGHTLVVKEVHRRLVSNGLLVFCLLPIALWIECAAVGWAGSSARKLLFERTPSTKTDLAVFIAGQAHVMDILARLMTLGLSMLSGMWLHDWLAATFGVTLNADLLPLPAQVVLFFFVYTFFDYWTHRLDHTRWFWPLHRYHHSADEFTVVTSSRQHPAVFSYIFVINMPMAALGASPAVMIWVNTIVIGLGFLIHSRIDSDWGWVGRWVVQSPVHHRLHHILDMSRPTGHFAMAPIWDRLFGTWRGDADQSLAIGVDTPYRHGFWVGPDLLRDYLDFWKGLIPGRRAAQ